MDITNKIKQPYHQTWQDSNGNAAAARHSSVFSQKLAEKVSNAANSAIDISNRFKANVFNLLKWAWSRINELPFLIRNPNVLLGKFYRWRVRKAMESQLPQIQTVLLSQILPAHPLDGNVTAEEKNQKRIQVLEENKDKFDSLLEKQETISQEFIEGLMESTSPIKLAYDEVNKRCIAFDGNSRLIAIKRFFAEFYPEQNPSVKVKIYPIKQSLFKHVTPERDFSLESK